MRSVGFDYPNTCPMIDKEIDKARGLIQAEIESILEQACPFMSWPDVQKHASSFAHDLYIALEGCFEDVRKTNSDMRDEAERQIESLKEEICDLEYELREARSTND